MPLKLLTVGLPGPNAMLLTYDATHSTPGRDGTTLSQVIEMLVCPNQTVAKLTIVDCDAPSPDEALARMSLWLRRLADGIDQRGDSIKLPLS